MVLSCMIEVALNMAHVTKNVALPYRCHITNLVKIDLVVLKKKMFTHVGRRTTHDDGRQSKSV